MDIANSSDCIAQDVWQSEPSNVSKVKGRGHGAYCIIIVLSLILLNVLSLI